MVRAGVLFARAVLGLWLSPERAFEQMPNLASVNEKIVLFEAGLDDAFTLGIGGDAGSNGEKGAPNTGLAPGDAGGDKPARVLIPQTCHRRLDFLSLRCPPRGLRRLLGRRKQFGKVAAGLPVKH